MKIHIVVHYYQITKMLRWALFIVTSLTMTMKIAEVSAYQQYEVYSYNPELIQYSKIVNDIKK